MRSRILVLASSVLVLGGSVVGAIAATSGGAPVKSAQSQYGETCPDGSPKPPGGNCGKPPETCPNGKPKPPKGNCGRGNPRGEGEKDKCREKRIRDRRIARNTRAKHKAYLGQYKGKRRARLARHFRQQERAQQQRHERRYRRCVRNS